MKIIGIGNALVDVLACLGDDSLLNEQRLKRGGMELIDDERYKQISKVLENYDTEMATGGSAGNTILALANLGARPGFIGRVGNDFMGEFFAQNCEKMGIEARLAHGAGSTGVANTFISNDGERTFATYLGEAAKLETTDVTPEILKDYGLIHIEGYLVHDHELIESVARLAKSQGLKISLDLASYNIVENDLDFFRHLVSEYVDIVFANQEESAAFTSGKNPEEALLEIAGMCEVAVVKLGKNGSSAKCGDQICRVPACEAKVLDTTAAGDFFAGGFLYAYSQGRSLKQCLEAGSLLSSKVIQVIGTKVTEETWQEIRKEVIG